MSTVVKCPKCKGRGKIHDKALGAFTCGISFLMECISSDVMETCPRCNGKGFIKV